MATDKFQASKSLKRVAFERFALAIIFVLANVTGRIDATLLNNLFSWSAAFEFSGFILLLGLGVTAFVMLTILFEGILRGVFKNVFLLGASVFLAILGGSTLIQILSPISKALFGLSLASEFADTPSWLVKSLVSAILFALLFRYESKASERLSVARNLAASLALNQKQLIETEEKQRNEASSFLHDRVQAQLMVLSLQIANVEKNLGEADAAELWQIRTKLEKLRSIDLRRVGQMLTPNIESFGIQHCLRQLIQQLEVTQNVDLQIDEVPIKSNVQLQLGLYRIIEQALINSITHGPASHIEVSAGLNTQSAYQVSVIDNGPGVVISERTPGYGTAVIQSWVAILGAKKEIFSTLGQGYKLTVTLSLDA